MMTQRRSRTLAAACLLAATATLAASGCSKSETSDNAGGDSSQGAQAAETPESSSGSGCSLTTYGAPKLDLKNAIVGFSQSEKEANPFRIAETQSIKDEAKKIGVKKLLTTNAQSQLSKQISDIQDMLSQGAQFLIIAPLNSDGLEPALKAAAAKKVPVLTVDRKVNSTACKDYVAFLGSDFVEQGKRAADAMIKATDGKAKVAILLGASGNNVTTDRTKGFVDQIKAEAPGIEIVAQQTGEFARDKGQQVMEQLLQSKPDIDAVYAENDEMGLGAVTAIKSLGKKPGKDVKVVSVDGTRNAVQALVNGEYNAVIESNPRFGPLAFATAQKFYGGEEIPENVIITDRAYDETNAKESLGGAF
ncbi:MULTISPECIES: ABC transporter substrate-binding protein [unclassified Streptomyces]|uniref:ABC transporter substrate-binding protein n=1 Tax=Streptomyces TaxID=1883 RepID=UPI0001C1A7E1|nr:MULTISPECIES: ABC transporter substrate-binding protein [unclassified Streptomyces]AEN08320.1 periplasmic binding protein/LacI transcriptional regulator [Streptomyces sp. SirexAA-E]MYR68454.1 substrate-binding domain-containing protein [Streptomyces sp. SID4939]MYS00374.1 substrate-binding domain-containing protein [Streptomyces sp. SID4940]MYT66536.1 substrate-binding domain-containing protein [Streptomyces sp. SID8357]MYT83457.1 substrate-binding domain-containing protein [Streptomyces sp